LAKKLPMQLRHSAIGNKPNENLGQFSQLCSFSPFQLQTTAHRYRCELLEVGTIDRDFSLKIAHTDLRGRLSHLAI